MASETQTQRLRVFFLPYCTAGHMIPLVDTARVFAQNGVDVTIVTTAANAVIFQKHIDGDANAGNRIRVRVLQFPSAQVGLPDGVENFQSATSMEMGGLVHTGFKLLRDPMERLFRESRPDCLVTDMFFPWTADVAAELGIPRIIFRVSSYFERCVNHSLRVHEPHKLTDSDVVSISGLPHRVELLRSQISDWIQKRDDEFALLMDSVRDSEPKSYGAIFNSFRELEGPYEDHYRNVVGMKSWSVGPIFLWDRVKGERYNFAGGRAVREEHGMILSWLSSKQRNSVLYMGFGTLTRFHETQLAEMAHGLESSGHPFIWVVWKNDNEGADQAHTSLPHGFEGRMRETQKGLVIKGWAPQKLILDHPSVGGMVTQCGWNSVLEGLTAGVPMMTWPLFAEQFNNERLLTDVLGVGVSVGVKQWRLYNFGEERKEEVVKREQIAKAVAKLMGGGEEAEGRRKRVKKLADEAKKAVERGGSSRANLASLINELKALKSGKSASGYNN
ncbi:UDP-glucuronosyl/UDP-glucosyltransferase [Parasponia andersonii]|uniref:Glycosyltransferase n=1 Tax=Parasponia andersonii TaxID=3476 RepID=A0A2P5B2J1_PARAD|nr:UDP-glucuronosyl/UDP-glucosyltransferase [Parasponia andersonii]